MKNKDQRGVVTIEMNGQTFRAEVQLGSSWFGDDDPRIFTFGFIADSPEAYIALKAYCREHMNAREAAEKIEQND
jgi:DNA-binding protein YbaB